MLENSFIILRQIIIMFLLMAAGYTLYRLHVIDSSGAAQCSGILAKLVSPCVIINSFQRTFDPALGRTLFWVFVFSLLTLFAMILLATVLYRPPKTAGAADLRMCAVFTNNGFMAIPLVDAMFGSLGVFLAAANIAASNILLWTWGVKTLSRGEGKTDFKKIFINPGTVACFIGLFCFLTPFKLPALPAEAVRSIANLNTPLAMIVLGCFLAQSDLKSCFLDKKIYFASFLRLIVLPLVCLALILLAPVDLTARTCLMIACCAPTAVMAAMFAQIFHTDYILSTRVVAQNTLLSVITMPAMIALLTALS